MNPLRRILPSLALAGLLSLGTSAIGQTQGFVTKTKTIRAAVLLLDGDKTGVQVYGQTAAPYAFYNLDLADSVKPGGWTFVNPYAPGTVNTEIAARYSELDNANVPIVGTPIGKRNGAYWTVSLSQLNDSQISNYDVLLVAPRNQLSLNSVERERLRRFVDGGGVLWVDLLGAGTIDPYNNLPLAVSTINSPGTILRDAASSLLSGTRQVTDGDISLFSSGVDLAIQPVPVANVLQDISLLGEFTRYRTIISSGNRPIVSEARVGDGALVVTSRGVAERLNRLPGQNLLGTTANSNVAFESPVLKPDLSAEGRAAARLAVNIVSAGGNFRQPGGGSRKNGSAATDPGSPVLSRFVAEGSYGPGGVVTGVPTSSPVTYKGFLVSTVGDRLVVFDAKPGRDLDGDGDEDDGIVDGAGAVNDAWRDASVGKQLDVVWVSAPMTAPLSSPVCAEVPGVPSADLIDQILVTDATGTLHVFQLNRQVSATDYRIVGGQHAELYNLAPPGGGTANYDNDPVTSQTRVNPPTVHDGLAYMTDSTQAMANPQGRVWIADLSKGAYLQTNAAWYVGGPSMSGTALPGFTAAPTIGYIPIGDNSGGVDLVLYAPGIVGNNQQPGFVSLWLGSKGESPTRFDADGTNIDIVTRASASAQLPIYLPAADPGSDALRRMVPHITVIDQNGNPLSQADMSAQLGIGGAPIAGIAPGVIRYSCNKTTDQIKASGYSIRIDYSIDWSFDSGTSSSIERGRILLPIRKSPSIDQNQRILGPIALTSRGTLHMVEASKDLTKPTGSYFAIREDAGRGAFRVVSRYTLYNQYNQTFASGGQTFAVPPVLADADAVQLIAGFPSSIVNAPLSRFRFAGGVALRNGIAYASINAQHAVIPVTMVAAFKAEPETPEIRMGTNLPVNPRLVQTDWARSDPNAVIQTPTQSTLAGDRLNIDTDNGIIRLENLATVTRNEITDCISLSQPVGIGGDARAYTFRQPDGAGDRWSPLLWYGLWNGGTSKGAPLVAGNEVFIAADSVLPGAIASGFTNFTQQNGLIWSVDADVPTTGVFATTVPNRPWLVQATQISGTDPLSIQVSPYYRMPQNRGITTFQDWAVRLNQTKIGTSDQAYGVAGGDGTVTAWGNRGLYGLSRADFVVADEGRLLRVDSSGNAISNAFGGRFSGIGNGGTASEYRALVRPVKAYPVGDDDYLVVDAGGNRVVRLDGDGTELRSIDRITLDPTYKPSAYKSNDPLVLKDPRDATTFEGYVYKGATDVVSFQQPVEYWIHTIIADSGNGRIVELIDRFNVDGQGRIGAPISVDAPDPDSGVVRSTPQVGVLLWQSPSLQETTKAGDYYNSISRVFVGSLGTGRYVYVAGVGRSRPTKISAGLDNPNAVQQPSASAGGAVVVFDPIGGIRVYDRFGSPDLRNVSFLSNPTTGTFDTTTSASKPAQDRPFSGVNSVSASTTIVGGQAGLQIMVSDADAVYEFAISSANLADPNGGGSLTPLWFINEAAFTALRPGGQYVQNARYFRPAYARRLDSGDVLVVNGYTGVMRGGAGYSGEVLLLSGAFDSVAASGNFDPLLGKANLGFNAGSIRFELPPLTGIRGLVSPVFADRR